jgi:hypothetical protein
MSILTVGLGEEYQTIAAAVTASQAGDTVEVAAGTYTNDFLDFSNSLTLEAVGGMVTIDATESPPDEKAIITEGATGADVTLCGFVLTGAAVSSDEGGNGAGIRYQGGNLTLTNDDIYDNQEGILGNPAVQGTGTVSIRDCEFAGNGTGAGKEHNIYINQVATLDVTDSLITAAVVGHEIKSRALDTIITNNVIYDGPNGSASYEIDVPQGGNATITGNVIEKGPTPQNNAFISYGEEEGYAGVVTNPGTSVSIADNTILNDFNSTAVVLNNYSTNDIAFTDNAVYGLTAGQLPANASGTAFLATEPTVDTTPPWSAAATLDEMACFVGGTRIATRHGEVAVEQLRAGDRVATAANGFRPIRWIGTRAVDCRRTPTPEKLWPVRVRPGACGDGQPHTDLWLSPDHSVCIGGVLIPVRYLVNGRTIVQEPRDTLTYWHVELERHDVILAEGLACESYLDTGNRGAFSNGGALVQMLPDFALRLWQTEACARLVLGGADLEAARGWILRRAARLGHATTDDPDLRLLTGGLHVWPERRGAVYRFRVPACAKAVRLRSRCGVPAEVRPDSTDHRRLGVAVSRVIYGGKEIPLTDRRLGIGWHEVEPDTENVAWRWTGGEAELVLPGRRRRLDIEVAITGRYWLDAAPTATDCAKSAGAAGAPR